MTLIIINWREMIIEEGVESFDFEYARMHLIVLAK